jgi:transglutaminase-like putative cysteine protease
MVKHAAYRYRMVTLALLSALAGGSVAIQTVLAETDAKIDALIEQGNFAEAEKLLEQQIADRSAPVTSEPAIQLEIIRRTRQDFPFSNQDILKQLGESIPDIVQKDVDRWREAGDLQARVIDGEQRYFRNAIGNLFRFSAEARDRRPKPPAAEKKFALDAHLEDLVKLAESSDSPELHPVKHNVRYELTVTKGNPRLKPGATVRAWLPFPQEYRQQKSVKLVRSEPAHKSIAENGSPHRSIYFEERVTGPNKPPRFMAEFEFVTSAFCPKLDPADVKPYDTQSEVYREFTAERPPHMVFSPEVKRLAQEIVGNETNPLKKARLVFHWVSDNIPWCSEMEYSIIPNIPEKALKARRGDCGVQGLTFITLCRAAGVPARWQSGWQTKPNDWNMHDWSEFYVEPWGWLPADASYGARKHDDPRVRDFFCGNMDPYRLIVNLDYGRQLVPSKTSFRSEPNDFQRGEVEIDGHNLYFGEWDWTFRVKTEPVLDRQ